MSDEDGVPIVDEPGLYDLPEWAYHADPVPGGSMSSTQARRILAPGCPALVEWERAHPVHKDVYDVGTVAHRLVLGKGAGLVEIKADDWRTKAAGDARKAAREAGHVALLSKDMQACEAMAAAVLAHPVAGKLLQPGGFVAERSIFWIDPETGIWRRAMCDALILTGGRTLIVDLKTTPSVAPEHIARSVANFGYHQQAAWYLDAADAMDAYTPAFLFVFVAKEPPHLVSVVELDAMALQEGQRLNRAAIDLWASCQETGVWPGYGDDLKLIGLPRWAFKDLEN